jgi:hypothetical protein
VFSFFIEGAGVSWGYLSEHIAQSISCCWSVSLYGVVVHVRCEIAVELVNTPPFISSL